MLSFGTNPIDRPTRQAAYSFVIGKEEHSALYDRPTQGSTELILPECVLRGRRLIEVVAGVKNVVSQKIVHAPMERVCSGTCCGIHHTPTPSETSAIGVREELKFSDALYAERSPDDAVAGAMIPEPLYGRAVQ